MSDDKAIKDESTFTIIVPKNMPVENINGKTIREMYEIQGMDKPDTIIIKFRGVEELGQ